MLNDISEWTYSYQLVPEMYISRFQVANYKSFREPKALEFTPGFNVISGQNNAGKTALLEALGLTFAPHPHRSIKTVPVRDAVPDQWSRADVSFALSGKELRELMAMSPGNVYVIAKPTLESQFARRIGFVDDSHQSFERLVAAVFSQDPLIFKIRFQSAPGYSLSVVNPEVPSYGLYPAQGPINSWYCFNFQVDRGGQIMLTATQSNSPLDIGSQLAGTFQKHVYRFSAERMNVGKGPHGHSTILAQNASNLHEVLGQLQHNPSRFRELNRQLNAILPQVKQVSVRGTGPGQVEVVVWCHDPETQREDLVIPLTESGTGIGQVLGIMYVVMTSDRPQTIIVDEPQSFLHPGAARKLIEFLKQHPQHQFIVATHSATIIAATCPKTITLARFEDGESTLQQLDAAAEKGIQTTLGELGIRLSDSFGADNILWVEGRTEEKSFPLIVEKIIKRPLMGTEILGIRQTGDLEGRDAKRVFEIYRTLTKGASLLPPAVGFILDQECRSESAKKELFKLSGELAIFLPRRMYENYLLNPNAIVEVANTIEGFRSAP
jgi:predicted ATPase